MLYTKNFWFTKNSEFSRHSYVRTNENLILVQYDPTLTVNLLLVIFSRIDDSWSFNCL